MAKYIQIDESQVERARELWPADMATISDGGELVFPNMTDEEYNNAPDWLDADASIPGAVVKER